jgi:hypothetical protein
VIEYNARWVPPTEWVMPYNPDHRWDGTVRFGASLQSYTNLGHLHGYTLVGCSSAGVNAFFVRNDQINGHFPMVRDEATDHYAAPDYTSGFGHPIRRR